MLGKKEAAIVLEEMGRAIPEAQWIRPAGRGAGARDACRMALFGLEVHLEARPEPARVQLTACDRYRLYVNGRPVVAGPLKGDQWNRYVETVDLSPYLKYGKNTLVAQVVSYALGETHSAEAAPYAIYTAPEGLRFLLEGRLGVSDVSTRTAPWRAVEIRAFHLDNTGTELAGTTEAVDLSCFPPYWRRQVTAWPRAEACGDCRLDAYGQLAPQQLKARPIPLLYETPRTFARDMPAPEGHTPLAWDAGGWALIPPHSRRTAVLDAGEVTTGYLELPMEDGLGAKVTLTYAERYVPRDPATPAGGMLRDDPTGVLVGQHDEVRCSGREDLWENFWLRAFRFVQIEVQTGDAALRLRRPTYRETGYPIREVARLELQAGWQRQLWDIAVRTLRRCTHETLEDCPYYEQLQYILDTRLQLQYHYALSGDTRLARKALWDYHCSQLPDGMLQSRYPSTCRQVIPAFSLHWIFMLEDYYVQTGDGDLARFYGPTADAVLAYFDRHVGELGLVEQLGYWDFCDWQEAWDAQAGVPTAALTGPSATHNLTYALALQAAARLAREAGRAGLAQEYEARGQAVCQAVRQHCFAPERGLLREGVDGREVTQHAQALAVLTGCLTGETARTALEKTLHEDDILSCSFPWQYTLFRALEAAGLYACTQERWQPYRDMLALHLTTLPERPGDTRSDCHAWSALPLYEFVRMHLGVSPGAPGWAEARIQPWPLGQTACSGVAPTAKGPIQVSWKVEGRNMTVEGAAPMPVTVILPDGRRQRFPAGHFHLA